MAGGGADGEVGDGVVGEDGGLLDQAGEAAQAGATDHPEHWPHLKLLHIRPNENIASPNIQSFLVKLKGFI